ncbi:hypothetical protein FI667_g2232, partial [Globisporangium splendens]
MAECGLLYGTARKNTHSLENPPREEEAAAQEHHKRKKMLESLLQRFLNRSADEPMVNQQPMDLAALEEKGGVARDVDMDEWVLLGTANETGMAAKHTSAQTATGAMKTRDRSYADVVAGRPSPRKSNSERQPIEDLAMIREGVNLMRDPDTKERAVRLQSMDYGQRDREKKIKKTMREIVDRQERR